MHDLKSIRDEPARFDQALGRRGLEPVSASIIVLDRERRAAQTELQTLQGERNNISRQIGQLKSKGENVDALMDRVTEIKDRMGVLEADEQRFGKSLDSKLAAIPNLPAEDVPQGSDETGNVEIKRWGTPRAMNFEMQAHYDLGEKLGLMDFSRAAKLSGARFTVLRGKLARLERALGNFMLDTHTSEFGYTEISPPTLVNDQALFGTGQLPKFREDQFQTTDGLWLIPTAEVPLTNLVADEVLDEAVLPIRMTAYTPCYRSEAGSAGRDTRGMIRLHQFSKVELVSIVHPDQSDAEHMRMTHAAETILQRLNLPYRVMTLCSGDMGFSARKTYDLEVWVPAQNTYRKISSCSNCGDFQARRMKARFKAAGEKNTRFVHTLNGSGLAVGRTLVAVLENYQNEDGSITVPDVLRPYFDGLEVIGL